MVCYAGRIPYTANNGMSKSRRTKGGAKTRQLSGQGRRSRKRTRRTRRQPLVLPRCVRDYAIAQSDVFALQDLPCVPDNKGRPSFRFMHRARGVFVANSNGVGYVAAAPRGVCSNTPFIDATQQVSVGDANSTLGSFTLLNTNKGVGCPYTSSELSTPVAQMRCVGAELRVRDINPALTRQGRMYSFRDPNNQTVQNQSTQEILNQRSACVETCETASHRWISSRWNPARSVDYDYTDRDGDNALVVGVIGAADGASFEYQFVGYYELIAETGIASVSRTASEAYPTAVAKIVSSAQNVFTSFAPVAKKAVFTMLAAYYGGSAAAAMAALPSSSSGMSPMIMDVD